MSSVETNKMTKTIKIENQVIDPERSSYKVQTKVNNNFTENQQNYSTQTQNKNKEEEKLEQSKR